MIFQFLLFFIWHIICKPFDDFESLSNVQFKIMKPCLTILIAKATFQSLKFGNLRFHLLISFKRYRSLFFCKWINGTVNYYHSKKRFRFYHFQFLIYSGELNLRKEQNLSQIMLEIDDTLHFYQYQHLL